MKIRVSLIIAIIAGAIIMFAGDWRMFASLSVIAIVLGLGDVAKALE